MKYLTFFLAACISLAPSPSEDYSPQRPHETVSKSMSTAEKNIRVAAVKVSTPRGGHGSGSIVRYKDVTIVITAQHVASDALGTNYLISKNGLGVLSTLIYSNEKYDIAVLYLPDKAAALIDAKPMAWNTVEDYDVGTDILYSGYPSFHKLMSFDGRIAGYEEVPGVGTHLIVNTYGWFGCSGAVIYDTKGKIIGVLYGVDVEYSPTVQVNENMIWVAPIKNIDIKDALGPFCRGSIQNYKACRR